MELLLNRSSSAARTSQLVLREVQHEMKGEVVVHPNVENDDFVYSETFEVNPAEAEVRRLVGSAVMVFRGVQTGQQIYVYGQSDVFKAAPSAIGVPVGLFQRMLELARQNWRSSSLLSLRTHPVWLRLGSRAVENRPIYQVSQDLIHYRAPGQPVSGIPKPTGGVIQPAASGVGTPRRASSNGLSSSRSVVTRRLQPAPAYRTYGRYVYDDRDDVCDVLFMTTFPGIAPFYRPNSLLAWSLWFNSMNYMPGQYFYDPYALNDWAFVPGFPGACSQFIVPFGDGYRVEILDGMGVCMGNFTVSGGYGEQMAIVTGDGDTFSVVNAGQPYIQYVNGDQAFCWNGVDEPFAGTQLEVQMAIADAGPLYEPGPMFAYEEPVVQASGLPDMDAGQAQSPVYGDTGVSNPFFPDKALAYNDDGFAQPAPTPQEVWQNPPVEPGYNDQPYVEQPIEEQSYEPDPPAQDEPVDTGGDDYSGGGDDYATTGDSSSDSWSSGDSGGDSWD